MIIMIMTMLDVGITKLMRMLLLLMVTIMMMTVMIITTVGINQM